ncbi:MAG: hypothetical protein WCQ77_01825 [Planctomycetota bacterium]
MAKKKQSLAQQTVGMATSWLPKPLADFFATPSGASLFMVAVPFLLASGVITINWSNGTPSVAFDQQRAAVVEQEIEKEVEQRVEVQAQQAAELLRAEAERLRSPAAAAQQLQPIYR